MTEEELRQRLERTRQRYERQEIRLDALLQSMQNNRDKMEQNRVCPGNDGTRRHATLASPHCSLRGDTQLHSIRFPALRPPAVAFAPASELCLLL